MNRVSSLLVFCSPENILRQVVIERSENNCISQIFSLSNNQSESAQTLFFDGIITGEIVSIKQNSTPKILKNAVENFNYFDFRSEFKLQKRPLLIDFGTDSTEEINVIISEFASQFSTLSVFEFMAACISRPALLLGNSGKLELNDSTDLILWEQVDLVSKRLTTKTRLRKI